MKRILFITPVLEYPPRGGPSLRIINSIKALSRKNDLFIYGRIPQCELGDDRASLFFKDKGISFLPSPLDRLLPDAPKNVYKWVRLLMGWTDLFDILHQTKRVDPDVIWLGYGNISYGLLIILKLLVRNKIVLDTDSVWSRFILRGIPFENHILFKCIRILSGSWKRFEEWLGTKISDMTLAVSNVDAEYYRKLTAHKEKIKIFPNIIDLNNYKAEGAVFDESCPTLYLSGTLGPHSAMEDAALWTLREIMPLIWDEFPNLKLYIVGRGPTDKILEYQSDKVVITGEVESTMPYLLKASVALVPLRYESGTRFKILEAAACRVPMISTTLGAEGLDFENGKDLIISDDPGQFPAAVRRLLTDHPFRARLTENAFRKVSDLYSLDTGERMAMSILEELNEPEKSGIEQR